MRSPVRKAMGTQRHADDLAVRRAPLALNAKQPPTRVENEVVSRAFGDRARDVQPQTRRVMHERRLGDGSLLARRELHDPNTSSRIGQEILRAQTTERAGASPQSCSRR